MVPAREQKSAKDDSERWPGKELEKKIKLLKNKQKLMQELRKFIQEMNERFSHEIRNCREESRW